MKVTKSLRFAGKLGVSLLLFVGIAFGVYRWNYPFGARTCAMPCVLTALRHYANEHGHAFPFGQTSSIECLKLLYPEYVSDAKLLAGISGDRRQLQKRLANGNEIDDNCSSWVYWPGFREDDDFSLAIIWERQPGIGFNGKRSSGHCVGFADGTSRQIPTSRWIAFVAEQERLRRAILATRSENGGVKVNTRH